MKNTNFWEMSDSNLDEEKLLELLLAEEGITMSSAEMISLRTQDINNQEKNPILSFAQQRMWFFHQIEPDNPFYNNSIALSFNGLLDITNLELSLTSLAQRHETLRTNFNVVDGQPVQIIAPTQAISLSLVDLQDLATDHQSIEVKQLIKAEAQIPFKFSTEALWRTKLLKLSEESHILIITIHHIISDGWSMGVLVNDLANFYQAFCNQAPPTLPALTVQYADFAEWQHQWLQGDRLASQLNYWKQQLDGALPILDLPSDRPRPSAQTYRGAVATFQCDRHLTQQLETLSQRSGVTLFMTLLTAFTVLLYRYSGQQDLVIGSPIANRNRVEIENLIGFFANTLPLRIKVDNNPTFEQLLTQVQAITLDAYSHQDLPFDLLVEELKIERHLSHNPIVQVIFALQNSPLPSIKLPNLEISQIVSFDSGSVRFDLEMHLWESPEGLRGDVVYSTDLFNSDTIQRLIGHFQTLLGGIVSNPQYRVAELPILTAEERQKILIEWQQTQTEYPRDKTIAQLFEEQVEKNPHAIAVVFGDQQLTYQELNQRANQLAHHLHTLGVTPNQLVGICVERSIEMLVSLLAILKVGGAYVPLDSNYPQERLAFIIQDAQISTILTQEKLSTILREKLTSTLPNLIYVDRDWQTFEQYTSDNLNTSLLTVNNLAYVEYTSGSTGIPKGVCVSHRGVVRLVKNTNYFNFNPDLVFLQLAPLSFDASTFEIWGSLLNGAKLAIMPPHIPSLQELGQAIRQYQVTTLWLTSGLFNLMVDERIEDLQSLWHLLAGGDALSIPHVQKFLQQIPNCQLINGYGPTENTTFTCCYPITSQSPIDKSVPIGRPISNTFVYILDSNLQPLPIGVTGELYIGGDGLALGYLNNLNLTTEKFIPNPFTPLSSDRLYKTGDLARYLEDGNIEFLGRMDFQVKIRGFRIELSEIELALLQHPDVRETVVIALASPNGNKQLVAYVIAEKDIDTSKLRSFLNTRLPDYSIPTFFIFLDNLPLNPNGKVDRRALPAPKADTSANILEENWGAALPTNANETLVANIWLQVLGLERIGIHDNFFDIGGNSLLVIQVHNRLQQMLNRDISIVDLFRYTTIKALAEYLTIDRANHDRDQKLPDPSRDRMINRTDKQKQALKRQQQLTNQRRQGDA
ncbi:non-ribosomal peptide synthetase [Pseudanabaena sp. ABRG5-3]|uniref:non-ribosomal peptide synthetase n=1 Tax=Pseudanabaena sp. ABRG5-3 TaxID=685565 RepID=UPI000DC6F7F9|nr:non-ribosomal peptide synthetase [Pseudanabaena sp. ABRG5-3]BBC27200.1 amino acid adenylation domain protein [Pseudanabaena sp. ABRG5-3]